MNSPHEMRSGFDGERMVRMPRSMQAAARRAHPLLRGLMVTGAGFFPRAQGHVRRRPEGSEEAVVLYCVQGGGWCEVPGGTHAVRAGDLVVLPPGVKHAYGSSQVQPWTLHWAHAVGDDLDRFWEVLQVQAGGAVVTVGEDLQLVLLFTEVLHALQRGYAFRHLFCASTALAHGLALAARNVQEGRREVGDGLRKVARCIEYMSEHLDAPLRVGALAALAGVSPAHLAALFQDVTGASPRDYLHLLRMHQACRWLTDTGLAVKEIAVRLGYRDPFHFSRTFKAFSGSSPSLYRQGRTTCLSAAMAE